MTRSKSQSPDGNGRNWRRQVVAKWQASAHDSGIDVSSFPTTARLKVRIAWAQRHGLLIAAAYARCSGNGPKSALNQLLASAFSAANNNTFVPAEYFHYK